MSPEPEIAWPRSSESVEVALKFQKKAPRLGGERSPLLWGPSYRNSEEMAAIQIVSNGLIEEYGGLPPTRLGPATVYDSNRGEIHGRFIAQTVVDRLTKLQIDDIMAIVRDTYRKSVKTITNSTGDFIRPRRYPYLEENKNPKGKQPPNSYLGWYMGPDLHYPVTSLHTGLLAFRDLGSLRMASYYDNESNPNWFWSEKIVYPTSGKPIKGDGYIVEIREGGLPTVDLVEFIVQTSRVLNGKKPLESHSLTYKIYHELINQGARNLELDKIQGLTDQHDRIRRGLILPLANPNLAEAMQLHPGSVLLVGVPGTGKTLLVEHLINTDLGVFIVPLNPFDLQQELSNPPEKRWIMDRVSQVSTETGIPVIIHLDDVEQVVLEEEKEAKSALLNLMAGVRERGFHVIAATNHPDKINPQLIQPQRFEHVIYIGLPDRSVRRNILEEHATRMTQEAGVPLFASDEHRNIILSALAEHTEGFTSRYLAAICTAAKSFLLSRVAATLSIDRKLTEADLARSGERFCVDDWARAFEQIVSRYDKRAMQAWDDQIRRFAHEAQESIGFSLQTNHRENEALKDTMITLARQHGVSWDAVEPHSEQRD